MTKVHRSSIIVLHFAFFIFHFAFCIACLAQPLGPDKETVGHSGPGRAVTPVNQLLTPIGRQVDLPGMRPQALALSPDGSMLVVSGKTSELVIVDPRDGTIRERVALPSDEQRLPDADVVSPQILRPDEEGQLSFTGLIFSPQGDRIYMSNVEGFVKVFAVGADRKVTPSHSFALPPAVRRGATRKSPAVWQFRPMASGSSSAEPVEPPAGARHRHR